MFHSARLQLTGWYLLIIMILSGLFSLVIFSSINAELKRIEHFQIERQQQLERALQDQFLPVPDQPFYNTSAVEAARQRVILTLLLINAGILGISGGAGFFLAGKTLRPIQEALQEQRRFVTDASHELRTPLTALRTELEVALRDKKLTLGDSKQLLASNLEEVIHLQSLSDGLLRLARGETKFARKTAEVALVAILEEALRKMQPLARQKKIVIVQEIEDVLLIGDHASLAELFIILIDNAIKYSPPKTIITLRSQPLHQMVKVSVIDQGMGIKKKDLPHIFDRFYRADVTRTHNHTSGYGLGLSIAKKIVEEHGGEIHVVSTTRTTFTVTLPLQKLSHNQSRFFSER